MSRTLTFFNNAASLYRLNPVPCVICSVDGLDLPMWHLYFNHGLNLVGEDMDEDEKDIRRYWHYFKRRVIR